MNESVMYQRLIFSEDPFIAFSSVNPSFPQSICFDQEN